MHITVVLKAYESCPWRLSLEYLRKTARKNMLDMSNTLCFGMCMITKVVCDSIHETVYFCFVYKGLLY